MRVTSAWTLDRERDERSRWSELSYYAPEAFDNVAVEQAALEAEPGRFAQDVPYYLGFGAQSDGLLSLPKSLDESLFAASTLPPGSDRAFADACRLISEADVTTSRSVAFIALASAVETLAKDLFPGRGKGITEKFKQFLADTLPTHGTAFEYAGHLYKLRCQIAHEGLSFPEDWAGLAVDSEHHEASLLSNLSWVVRLATVNWIRRRSNLPMIGAR